MYVWDVQNHSVAHSRTYIGEYSVSDKDTYSSQTASMGSFNKINTVEIGERKSAIQCACRIFQVTYVRVLFFHLTTSSNLSSYSSDLELELVFWGGWIASSTVTAVDAM
jgi:hypothetical protein